ncbi:hypothetical protein ADIARSV_0130 [Arcticibacter svalbardensis MN12-7]|uniref:Lipoprotein n=1 Tax=Arcticibacter svalbardensis MN12-7 TaxID=1150600 RepID=R9GY34_9SPHI|nr:hypothetical protein [Arcticibacter svalbardensis]EOR96707.1 hypothetical protein ADIARSV_0130 [Arcticibacter svalbardensis MN12-7]
MKIKLLLLALVSLTFEACGQERADEYFNMEFLGHKFINVASSNFNDKKLEYMLWNNIPRDWHNTSTTQFLIAKTASNDTLLITVHIEFSNTLGGVSSAKLQKGSFPMGKNAIEVNSNSKCPFPEGRVGPYIEVRISPVNQETSKVYTSGFYRFHHDDGNIVIEDMQTHSNGIGLISGYFDGTVSQETTNIDTHLDGDAACKKENYKYETHPIKGKFRLHLKLSN